MIDENKSLMGDQKLPNATAVLVLGILSILGACCYGIPGLIMGIIGIVLAKKDTALYKANPTQYSNYSNVNTGKILSIIGVVLGVLALLYFAFIIMYFGMDALQDQELMKEKMEDLLGQ